MGMSDQLRASYGRLTTPQGKVRHIVGGCVGRTAGMDAAAINHFSSGN